MTVGTVQIQNLLYVLGALVAASLWISGLYVLRHRKPKSVEAGIESFSKGLRALAPERRPTTPSPPAGGQDATAPPARAVRPVLLLHPDAGVVAPQSQSGSVPRPPARTDEQASPGPSR